VAAQAPFLLGSPRDSCGALKPVDTTYHYDLI
jgi:hypothetical protein